MKNETPNETQNRFNEHIEEVEIKNIQVLNNSRIRLDDTELASLMQDIKQRGLLQPIGLLQPNPDKKEYVLRYGWRRLNAFKKLGYKKINAIVRTGHLTMDKLMADNVAENVERVDLSPSEFANVCKRYRDQNYSVGEIAVLLSESEHKIKQSLRILNEMPEEARQDLIFQDRDRTESPKGKVSISTANSIMNLRVSKAQKEAVFNIAKKEELSLSQVNLIGKMICNGLSVKESVKKMDEYAICTPTLLLNKEKAKQFKIKHKLFSDKAIIRGIIYGKFDTEKGLFLESQERKYERKEED